MNITQPKMLPAYAAQVVPAGTITITFTRENPYYPTGEAIEVPLYKMPIAANSHVIQWGGGIIPLQNLTANDAASVTGTPDDAIRIATTWTKMIASGMKLTPGMRSRVPEITAALRNQGEDAAAQALDDAVSA